MEVMQKISDKPLARHAKCGGKLEKEWSRTGFQFKGTGWYVTDYAGRKPDAKDGGESKEVKESKADSKADSAAETKAASAEPKGEAKTKGGKKTAGAPTSGGD
jgi:predicted nucleic acid-binding Zn ribbon protein